MKNPEIERINSELIPVPDRHRAINAAALLTLAESMAKIGLRTPITQRAIGDTDIELVAGAHRLAAAKHLGWEKIDCIVLDCDEAQAEMWEIAENLHRAELSQLERSEHIARWVELAREYRPGPVQKAGHPRRAPRRTADELSISKTQVQRAISAASLTPDAKGATRAVGRDDNLTALNEAAAQPASQQAEYLRNRVLPKDRAEVEEDQKRRLMTAWNAASPAVKAWFKDEIDQPVMDRRFGT